MVSILLPCLYSPRFSFVPRSGLDNAGKTTIVKKFNGQDINKISPTLGFDIHTFEYRGYVCSCLSQVCVLIADSFAVTAYRSIFGTLEGKKLCDLTGVTISSVQMVLCGLLIVWMHSVW